MRETFATTVPGDDVVINRAGQSVAMAVGLPMRREIAAQARLPERLEADLLIIFEGGRFPRHRGKTTLPSSAQAVRASPISVSLPAPLGPTTRMSRPGPIMAVDERIWSALQSRHAVSFTPDTAHHRHIARHMHPDQIGALADCDLTAIRKTDGLRGRLGDGPDGGRQIDRRHALRQLQCRHQQA